MHLYSQHDTAINPFTEAVMPINMSWLDTYSMWIISSPTIPWSGKIKHIFHLHLALKGLHYSSSYCMFAAEASLKIKCHQQHY